MKKIIGGILAAAVIVVAAVVALMSGDGKTDASLSVPAASSRSSAVSLRSAVTGAGAERSESVDGDSTEEDELEEPDSEEEPLTEEEKREAEEEKQVDAFDDLTDKWQEPSAKGVTMSDIENFAKSFHKLPKARQDECIHRALNLIPDENVMLLAGVLMDKTVDKEIVEEVYNDVLNRDEDVKKPILQQIFKDKTHPCWADTAWILDVTDELPKK